MKKIFSILVAIMFAFSFNGFVLAEDKPMEDLQQKMKEKSDTAKGKMKKAKEAREEKKEGMKEKIQEKKEDMKGKMEKKD
jgi:ABC-type transporter MlaC component